MWGMWGMQPDVAEMYRETLFLLVLLLCMMLFYTFSQY